MGCPSERLSSIPRGKRVGGETRVNKSKVSLVVGVDQVMVVLIDLDRSELSFVDDVLV